MDILIGYQASKLGVKILDHRYLSDNKHWKGIFQLYPFPSLDTIGCFSRVSGQVFYNIILPVNLSKFQVFQDCQSTLIVEEKISIDHSV